MTSAQIRYIKRLRAHQQTYKWSLRNLECTFHLKKERGDEIGASEVHTLIDETNAYIAGIEAQIIEYKGAQQVSH